MKKFISVVLLLVLALTMLTGCSTKKPMEIVKEGRLAFDPEITIDEMAQNVLLSGACSRAYYEDIVIEEQQYTNLYFEIQTENMSLCLSFLHGENEEFQLYDVTTTDADGYIYRMEEEDALEIVAYLYGLRPGFSTIED